MRDFDGAGSWNLRIGEVKIQDVDNNTTYLLVVGYVAPRDKIKIYIRLYDANDNDHFILGTWLDNLSDFLIGDPNDGIAKKLKEIPEKVISDIKKQTRRLEALKAFV